MKINLQPKRKLAALVSGLVLIAGMELWLYLNVFWHVAWDAVRTVFVLQLILGLGLLSRRAGVVVAARGVVAVSAMLISLNVLLPWLHYARGRMEWIPFYAWWNVVVLAELVLVWACWFHLRKLPVTAHALRLGRRVALGLVLSTALYACGMLLPAPEVAIVIERPPTAEEREWWEGRLAGELASLEERRPMLTEASYHKLLEGLHVSLDPERATPEQISYQPARAFGVTPFDVALIRLACASRGLRMDRIVIHDPGETGDTICLLYHGTNSYGGPQIIGSASLALHPSFRIWLVRRHGENL